jgi:hypothetical protein
MLVVPAGKALVTMRSANLIAVRISTGEVVEDGDGPHGCRCNSGKLADDHQMISKQRLHIALYTKLDLISERSSMVRHPMLERSLCRVWSSR